MRKKNDSHFENHVFGVLRFFERCMVILGDFLSSAPKITYTTTFLGLKIGVVVENGWLKSKFEDLEAWKHPEEKK